MHTYFFFFFSTYTYSITIALIAVSSLINFFYFSGKKSKHAHDAEKSAIFFFRPEKVAVLITVDFNCH